MFVRGERVIYSASDLILAADCEYALLRELDFKLGRGVRVDPPPDEMLERAITLGEAHEARVLQGFISEFGIWDGASSGVAQIARRSEERRVGKAGRGESGHEIRAEKTQKTQEEHTRET